MCLTGRFRHATEMTNFEHSLRIPMMIAAPGIRGGVRSTALTMEMDIFPTIAQLAGLAPVPACPAAVAASRKVDLCTEGSSLVPLLAEPATGSWTQAAAFSQFPRPEHPDKKPDLTGDPQNKMGYSVRVDGYRYTEWVAFDRPSAKANWSNVFVRAAHDTPPAGAVYTSVLATFWKR